MEFFAIRIRSRELSKENCYNRREKFELVRLSLSLLYRLIAFLRAETLQAAKKELMERIEGQRGESCAGKEKRMLQNKRRCDEIIFGAGIDEKY